MVIFVIAFGIDFLRNLAVREINIFRIFTTLNSGCISCLYRCIMVGLPYDTGRERTFECHSLLLTTGTAKASRCHGFESQSRLVNG